MNPNADAFIPNQDESHKDHIIIPTENLSHKQTRILRELITEWTTAATIENVLTKWENRRQKTFIDMLNIRNELSLLLLNINSLKLYLHDLFELLNTLQVSIIVLNGTRDDKPTLKYFSSHFSNFQVFFQEGTNDCGGVLIATHRSIPVQRVTAFQNDYNLVVLDIGDAKHKLQLASCYSPPKEPLPINVFNNLLRRNSNTILLGDLNAKHATWSKSTENEKGRPLYEWLHENDLQVVNKFVPTSTRSNAVIDLILVPTNIDPGTFSVLPSIGSDHYPVVWTSTITIPSKDCYIPVKRTYWPLFEIFITLTSSFWDKLSTNMPDKTEFFGLYERFLALSSSRLTYVSYCKSYRPSIPPEIVSMIQLKCEYLHLVRKTRHPHHILQLKLLSNQVRKAMFIHKRNMWGEYCKSLNSCDIKQFWRKARRHFSSYSPPIEGFLLNGVNTTCPTEMCKAAEKFYLEQFSEHENNRTEVEAEAEILDQELQRELQNAKSFSTPAIHFLDVRKAIATLKNKNSTGLDGVSNRIIKLLPSSHVLFITSSFNYMAQNVCFPRHWRTAKMILLSKTKSSLVDLDETRPISLLPCFSKVYEKLFLTHLRKWISDNGILPDEQTGFRPGHNMSARIVSIIDQIGQGLTVNTATAAVFVDFKTAFNQLWTKGLWIKLRRLNCPPFIIAWLRNYLSERSAYIEIKDTRSRCFPLFKGVPQGSCVGPVLFIVFHYDILNSISNLHFKHLFADDLAIIVTPSVNWSSTQLIPYLGEQITNVLKDLYAYSQTWKQPINFKKTHWTIFHRQVFFKIPTIFCGNNVIDHVSKFKYLGTILDAKLSFSSHLDFIRSKIHKNLGVFKRLSRNRMLSQEVSYRLYYAYIRPYYQSILNIYPLLSQTKQEHLEAMNRRIFRLIHRWFDALNDEIINIPAYKSIELLTHLHYEKLLSTIIRTNPAIISDFLQHKLYLLYMNEYYTNPLLRKEKRAIVSQGRTSNRIHELITIDRQSLFDKILCFRE